MFLKIQTMAERQALGGSDFIELQYCKLPPGTSEKTIVSVDAIDHWDTASLYIRGEDICFFFDHYKEIFNNGLCHNLRETVIDLYGINYYNAEKTNTIVDQLKVYKPTGFETLLEWLQDNPHGNGFYVLGI